LNRRRPYGTPPFPANFTLLGGYVRVRGDANGEDLPSRPICVTLAHMAKQAPRNSATKAAAKAKNLSPANAAPKKGQRGW
jgi:hypothetical protein